MDKKDALSQSKCIIILQHPPPPPPPRPPAETDVPKFLLDVTLKIISKKIRFSSSPHGLLHERVFLFSHLGSHFFETSH